MLSPPSEQLGQDVVRQFGSIPCEAVETEVLRPGEVRKICLALGLLEKPWVIIMDEPTNHLDLPATELLEGALAADRIGADSRQPRRGFPVAPGRPPPRFSGNSMSSDS